MARFADTQGCIPNFSAEGLSMSICRPRLVARRVLGIAVLLSTVTRLVDAQSHCPKEVVGHTNKGNTWDGHLIGERPVTEESTQNSGTASGTVSGTAGTPAGGGGASVSGTTGSTTNSSHAPTATVFAALKTAGASTPSRSALSSPTSSPSAIGATRAFRPCALRWTLTRRS